MLADGTMLRLGGKELDRPGLDLAGVHELRRALPPAPCPVLDAPAAVRERIEVWDTAVDPGALELMRRVKKRFDPGGVCNRRLPAGV